MSRRDLRRIASRFTTVAARLENSFVSSENVSSRAFSVIGLYAAWEEFSLRLAFSSAYAQPHAGYTHTHRISRAPGLRTRDDVEVALKRMKNTRAEYRLVVHLGAPSQMVRTCKYLKLANESTISAAILSQNSPADELRKVRNFLSHQNADTADQVDLGRLRPKVEVLQSVEWLDETLAGGRSRFGMWANDLSDVARACAN